MLKRPPLRRTFPTPLKMLDPPFPVLPTSRQNRQPDTVLFGGMGPPLPPPVCGDRQTLEQDGITLKYGVKAGTVSFPTGRAGRIGLFPSSSFFTTRLREIDFSLLLCF